MEKERAWYNSQAYQQLAPIRQKASRSIESRHEGLRWSASIVLVIRLISLRSSRSSHSENHRRFFLSDLRLGGNTHYFQNACSLIFHYALLLSLPRPFFRQKYT